MSLLRRLLDLLRRKPTARVARKRKKKDDASIYPMF